ncbi:hypothetical protein DYE50_11590 [Treponema ruminis]|uniref:Uracil-DNA glycosylase n=1 Tax=Treponema ruminis TaxID=744515 RepID=A0A7W8G8L1_9SPIR|nr:hypothetical protein [Treponema ruminis]QSI03208.1 hypothetical protein DYE50_11590 [Treponema ruminis]
MTPNQFEIFSDFRDEFCTYCMKMNKAYGDLLKPLQIAASADDTPDYPVETPVVYNSALDEITEKSDIRMIVIGDNPGKDEQLDKNKKYLVGQSGKLAAGFFEKNAEFNTDFRKNVIILNKTPVHTAKTTHLKYLLKKGGNDVRTLILESQIFMAEKTAMLHQALCNNAGEDGIKPELWLVGYAELKDKGLFLGYKKELSEDYDKTEEFWNRVYVFQHFSMNRFSIDLKTFMSKHSGLGIVEAAHELGSLHKKEIFG